LEALKLNKSHAMHPLQAILKWWESLEEFPRCHIAADVCFRLTSQTDVMDRHEELFRDYLEERLNAVSHVGRAIAVRAVIDYIFLQTNLEDSLRGHLENVEGEDAKLRQLSNAAIGQHLKVSPEWKTACRKWRKLKKAALLDETLFSWERLCVSAAMRKRFL
jgi:hypothetical protein